MEINAAHDHWFNAQASKDIEPTSTGVLARCNMSFIQLLANSVSTEPPPREGPSSSSPLNPLKAFILEVMIELTNLRMKAIGEIIRSLKS